MKKFIYKLLFLLFSFSLCSCNKNNVINNDLFLGEIRAQLNTVYTINCTVEPANHTGNIEWSSNWPGFVEIVESSDSYCKIKRVKPYANAVGNYVVITATIDNLVARCIVYEENFNTDNIRIGIERCDGSDDCQDGINLYIDYVDDNIGSQTMYFEQVGAFIGGSDDSHDEVLDTFTWNVQQGYPTWFAHLCHYNLIDSLSNGINFDDNLLEGIMVDGIVTFNGSTKYFCFDYL